MGKLGVSKFDRHEKIDLMNRFLVLCVLTSLLGFALSGCGQPGTVIGESKKKKVSAASIPEVEQPQNDPVLPVVNKKLLVQVEQTNKADVIIVIDNSASMRFEQENMAQRFSSLLDEMKVLDWRLGIITTDVSRRDQPKKDGRFLEFAGMPGVFHLSSEMEYEKVKSAFAATIQRPAREGHANEQGIKATFRAIERKPEWFRSDASLNVVVVTDADETPYKNKAEIRNNPSDLLRFVKSTYPSKKFFFHSIIVKEGDESCLKKDDNESYGRTYAWLSEKTGGIVGDVCQSDYSNQLKMIGEKVSQQIKSLKLECEPMAGSVLIKTQNGDLITSFKIEGIEIRLGEALPAGTTEVNYQCLQKP